MWKISYGLFGFSNKHVDVHDNPSQTLLARHLWLGLKHKSSISKRGRLYIICAPGAPHPASQDSHQVSHRSRELPAPAAGHCGVEIFSSCEPRQPSPRLASFHSLSVDLELLPASRAGPAPRWSMWAVSPGPGLIHFKFQSYRVEELSWLTEQGGIEFWAAPHDVTGDDGCWQGWRGAWLREGWLGGCGVPCVRCDHLIISSFERSALTGSHGQSAKILDPDASGLPDFCFIVIHWSEPIVCIFLVSKDSLIVI